MRTDVQRDDDATEIVHQLANHVATLVLGLSLVSDEPTLPAGAGDRLGGLYAEARAASRLVLELQQVLGEADRT